MAEQKSLQILQVLAERLGNRIEEYRDEAGKPRLRCQLDPKAYSHCAGSKSPNDERPE